MISLILLKLLTFSQILLGVSTVNSVSGMSFRSFCVSGSEDGYFTGILLRKDRVQFLQSNIVKYPTTEMDRNLLIAHVGFSYPLENWFNIPDYEYCFFTFDHIYNEIVIL